MAQLEIFQNGTSLSPDTMGDPVFQIGTKNSDGSYELVVSEGMTDEEAKAKLLELQPVKAAPKKEPVPKKKVVVKKTTPKKVAKKKVAKKKVVAKKKDFKISARKREINGYKRHIYVQS